MNFEIYQDVNKQWRFRLVARNGEIVAVSESYTRKANVKRACRAIITDMQRFGTEIKEINQTDVEHSN